MTGSATREAAREAGWAVVIPVRGADGKSRLDHERRALLSVAFGRDTVRAATAAAGVERIVVVTPVVTASRHARVRAVRDPGAGLGAAIATGLRAVDDPRLHRAVLLGDLPSLRAEELAAALASALLVPRAFVPDADGTGTTLATARRGYGHRLAFGPGSADAHRRAGYVPLVLSPASGLRRDVDTAADLTDAVRLRVGRSTAAALAGVNGS